MALSALIFSALLTALAFLPISGNVRAHSPAAVYPTYKEGMVTVYIDHESAEPDTHYIKKVTIHVNRLEVLNETYTSQKVDDEKGKGMVVYSYNVTASDGDVMAVTVECSVSGSVTGTLTVGEDDGKDEPLRDDTDKDKPEEDDPAKESGMKSWVLYSIIGAVIAIIVLAVVIRIMLKGTATKGKSKDDDWTTCPKCGTDLMVKSLQAHLDTLHSTSSKKGRE